MKKTINAVTYYIPTNLTSEQIKIYCHIIDWKRENITKERGVYKGSEYDAFFPINSSTPSIMYKPILPQWEEMQQSKFVYKLHNFTNHAVSSQNACINLFMPLLLSDEANSILPKIPGSPLDFKEIARDRLFKGFCFEYWGQDIKQGKGLLNDHSALAGTDADVAIAYYNIDGELCLWLIEHKLSEKKFTECGAYKSKANKLKEDCKNYDLATISESPQKCLYHVKGYKYWEYLNRNFKMPQGNPDTKGCPFRLGLNQLWRNQMLAFSLKETGIYKTVTFSVCHHAKNTMLKHSIEQYKALVCKDKMFSSFTNYDILNIIKTNNPELEEWKQWYDQVYCF